MKLRRITEHIPGLGPFVNKKRGKRILVYKKESEVQSTNEISESINNGTLESIDDPNSFCPLKV